MSDDDTAPLFDEPESGEFFDDAVLGQWRRGPWRKPDVNEHLPGGVHLIWYGPHGRDGDVATELIADIEAGTIAVSEYNSVVGLFDEGAYDPDYPFAKQTTKFAVKAVLKALRDERIKPKRGTILLWAAGLGVAQLAHYGGAEEMVESLP
jgi:hypothetical protein